MDSESRRLRRLNFSKRMRPMRTIGLGVGSLCVGAVLHEHAMGTAWWVLLVCHVLVWPQLAYLFARRSHDPVKTEYRNLVVDAMAGGLWIAVMAFDTLPSVLLAVMLTMDKVIVGGRGFSARTFAAMAATCLVVSALLGFPFDPYTSYVTMLARRC
jgi:diguanylate cyclase